MKLKTRVRTLGYVKDAVELVKCYNCSIKEYDGSWFTEPKIKLEGVNGVELNFKNYSAFIYWVQQNLT